MLVIYRVAVRNWGGAPLAVSMAGPSRLLRGLGCVATHPKVELGGGVRTSVLRPNSALVTSFSGSAAQEGNVQVGHWTLFSVAGTSPAYPL